MEKTFEDSRFYKIISSIVPLLFLFVPVLFVPVSWLDFMFLKWILFVLILVIAFAFIIINSLKEGSVVYFKDPLMLASLFLIVASLLSTIFSGSFTQSLIGFGYEMDSFVSVFLLLTSIFVFSVFLKTKDSIFYAYMTLLVSFLVMALFHVLRLVFGPEFLSMKLFLNPVSNFFGKWNDLGVFFGLISILSLISIEFLSLNRVFKALFYILLALSLLMLAVVNFSFIWTILFIFSVILFVYIYSFRRGNILNEIVADTEDVDGKVARNGKKNISFVTLVVICASLVFILFGSYINDRISTKFNLMQVDVRPSWSATFSVAKNTLADDPILGAGPNQFLNKWLLYKNPAVNMTNFWSADFNTGVGFIPTFMVTGGALGIIGWIGFIVAFLWLGFKALFKKTENRVSKYLVTSSFVGSLFLLIMLIVYNPSLPLIILSFMFIALFFSASIEGGIVKEEVFEFGDDSKKNFIATICLAILLFVVVFSGYLVGKRFIAGLYFAKSLYVVRVEGNLDKTEKLLLRANSINETDLYYRALSEVDIVRINNLANSLAQKQTTQEEALNQMSNLFGIALNNVQKAIEIDKKNYQNWLSMAYVYETIMRLGVLDAYDKAQSAYGEALRANPLNPSIYLSLARLEVLKKDYPKARLYIGNALQLKNNYVEAVYYSSQIEVADKNIKGAIDSLITATYMAPNDFTIFFELGLLYYNDLQYTKAIENFEKSVSLNPQFANGKYFLGLSYEKKDRFKEAIALFEDLKKTNPDNKDLDKIIDNIKSGKNPLTGINNQAPSKSTKLPVGE